MFRVFGIYDFFDKHKAFFSDDRFLDSLHKSFLNQTTIDLRKEKWTFLNREFTVLHRTKVRWRFRKILWPSQII